MLRKAQSEILSTMILTALTIIFGALGFYLASSIAVSKYSEGSFASYAEKASREFIVTPMFIENNGSNVSLAISIMRIGILGGYTAVRVSMYGGSVYVGNQSWWRLTPLIDGQNSMIRYNISSISSGGFNISLSQAPPYTLIEASKAYVKISGMWWILGDVGGDLHFIGAYAVGTLSRDQILLLDITAPQGISYIYIVIWTAYGDRYIASPLAISIS